jgi:hypothetical protein
MYTVELYKRDGRKRSGERLVRKSDHSTADITAIRTVYDRQYPAVKGYRYEIHETYVTSRNVLTGEEFRERYDTPYYCSPRSETFWSA